MSEELTNIKKARDQTGTFSRERAGEPAKAISGQPCVLCQQQFLDLHRSRNCKNDFGTIILGQKKELRCIIHR